MPPVLKPPACRGCPFEHRSKYWVEDEIVPDSEVVILSQNPGVDEEAGRRLIAYEGKHRVYETSNPAPLIGVTGYDLGRKYLPLTGLERGRNVSLANPIRCRPEGANELPPVTSVEVRKAIEHCQFHYYKPPPSTRLVIAEGVYALYAATGEDGSGSPGHKISRGIDGWRGWVLPWSPPPRPKVIQTDVYRPSGVVVLPTYHLAYLYRAPWYTPVSQRDWSKVQAILKGEWPEVFPEVWASPPVAWPSKFAFDTEFYENTLVRYSLAYRRRSIETGAHEAFLWVVEREVHSVPDSLPPRATVIFHQVEADLDYLGRLWAPHSVQVDIEDTMYLHAVLHADLDHTLDFLGSIYARTNRWKHLLKTNPRVYAGGDALGTWDAFVAMSQELERDPRVGKVYREYQLPLATIIHKARTYGLRVIPERVTQALQSMEESQREVVLRAQAHVGWPLNLASSQQVGHELYKVERVNLTGLGRVRRT